jgi:hypothetical protein
MLSATTVTYSDSLEVCDSDSFHRHYFYFCQVLSETLNPSKG